LLAWAHVAPLIPDAPFIGYIMGGISLVMLVVAYLVLVPRVPGRELSTPVAAYWATPEIAQSALLVWFVMEGAGVFSAVGFLITALPLNALVMAGAIGAFWLTGPKTFAKE